MTIGGSQSLQVKGAEEVIDQSSCHPGEGCSGDNPHPAGRIG